MTERNQADFIQLMRMPQCFYRTRHRFGLNPPCLYGSHRTMIKLLTFELQRQSNAPTPIKRKVLQL